MFVASTWRPTTTQARSKTGPRSSWIDVFFSSIIVPIFDRFGIGFGANLASQMEAEAPLSCANRPLWRSKTVLGSTWFGSFFVLSFGLAFLTFLSSSWGRFGPLLAPFWPSSALLAPLGGTLGVICDLLGAGVPFVGAVLQPCLSRCSLFFASFACRVPLRLFVAIHTPP